MEITNKYQNGKIYKITDIGYNKCYIGSTTEELSMRMARHRANFKRFLNGSNNNHTRSFDIFNEYGFENCKIELVEYCKCDTLQELRKREGEHIKNTDCVNKYVAGRTNKEYYEDNKDKIIEHQKEYRINNKDKIKEHDRQRYAENKEKINKRKKEYYENNKEKIKETEKKYKEQNKDKIKEQNKEYREKNKEKINEWQKVY